MRRSVIVLPLLMLAGCGAPSDVQYCRAYGVEGTAEYGKCLSYYSQQEATFQRDRDACEIEADATYPPSLYDRGHYAHSHAGWGPHGRWYGGHTIRIDPDWHHNREVDRLRMRVIEPCMQARGWNSGRDWQAGRHKTGKKPGTKPAQPLPWQR